MQKFSMSELAGEGERLCKLGDWSSGLKFFDEALAIYNEMTTTTSKLCSDTHEQQHLPTVSVIYNQMGNAYFQLHDYDKALHYHHKDLAVCELLDDEAGKAKACGNIGNQLQLLGDYDQAIYYSQRSCDLAHKLNDKAASARALYNLANIYQSKGKHMGRLTYNGGGGGGGATGTLSATNSSSSSCSLLMCGGTEERTTERDFPIEIKEVLLNAVCNYRKTLEIVSAAKDRAAEGRTYGNVCDTNSPTELQMNL